MTSNNGTSMVMNDNIDFSDIANSRIYIFVDSNIIGVKS